MTQAVNELERVVARTAVAQYAPAELPLFEPTADAFFAAGKRLPAERRGDILGGGFESAAIFLSPVALMVSSLAVVALKKAVDSLAADAGKLLAEQGEQGLKRLWAWVRERRGAPEPVLLPESVVAEICAKMLEEAQRFLAPDMATQLVDAVARQLIHPQE
jgi:hypothetical protein